MDDPARVLHIGVEQAAFAGLIKPNRPRLPA
jgi:hypothetical protein